MSEIPVEIRAPDPRRDRSAVYELTARVFGRHHGYWEWLRLCRERYFECSTYDWAASRIGVHQGRVVSHFGVWAVPLRIGSTVARVAGIGAVATDGSLLRRGLMRRTAEACVRALGGHGYDFSLLFGIERFYHRYGFVRAFPWSVHVVQTSDLPENLATVQARRWAYRSGPELDRLHAKAFAGLTGSAVRPFYAEGNPFCHGQGWRWLDRRGRLRGACQLAVADGVLMVEDFVGPAEEVLSVVAALARRERLREVRFPRLHSRSELARMLLRGNCRWEQDFRVSGGAMVRLVSLERALRQMQPELAQRWSQGPLARRRVRLDMHFGGEQRAVIESGPDGLRILGADAPAAKHRLRADASLVQLLIGHREVSDLIRCGEMHAQGDGAALGSILFPVQEPMLGHWDGF